jgi:hypothetical protein
MQPYLKKQNFKNQKDWGVAQVLKSTCLGSMRSSKKADSEPLGKAKGLLLVLRILLFLINDRFQKQIEYGEMTHIKVLKFFGPCSNFLTYGLTIIFAIK